MAAAHIHVYVVNPNERILVRTFGGNRSTVRAVARMYLRTPGFAVALCRGVYLPETEGLSGIGCLVYSKSYIKRVGKEKQHAQK